MPTLRNAFAGLATEPKQDDIILKMGDGSHTVKDDYVTEDHETDQTGSGIVLDFAITPSSMVMIDVDPTNPTDTNNYRCRATTNGTVPTSAIGFVCRPGTTYLPISSLGIIKVFAPVGVTVAVQGLGR